MMEENTMHKPLYRSRDKIIGGVCGGLAENAGMDPSIVRILVALFALLSSGFPVVLLYVIAWIVIPAKR
jgi:phage shock protein C